MKHRNFLPYLRTWSLTVLMIGSLLSSEAKTRKTVFIILDGIPADMIERLQPPTIQEIASHGGYSRAFCGGTVGRYDQTPTISAVGYACILTSCWANKHNVWDNAPQVNYNYRSIFHTAKAQKRAVSTAIFSSWTDNRTLLLGEGRPETDSLVIDQAVDGLDLDTQRYPKKQDDLHIFDIDEVISQAAADTLRTHPADLNWVYLWYTDDAGHIYGNSDFFDDYTLRADRQVARIWEAVKYREANFDEEWMVVVTTDHGRGDDGHHHGGQSMRERTCWISTNVTPNARFGSESLAITDINPSICRYMGFTLPQSIAWEQDGTPFIGKADLVGLEVSRDDQAIELRWKSLNDKASATIYCAQTNQFRTGGTDQWVKIGRTKAGVGSFRYTVPNPQGFYKFAVVTANNHLTGWLPEAEAK